jgi:hypothetical protein
VPHVQIAQFVMRQDSEKVPRAELVHLHVITRAQRCPGFTLATATQTREYLKMLLRLHDVL